MIKQENTRPDEDNVSEKELIRYVKEQRLTFVPGNYGYGAGSVGHEGSTIKQGVSVFRRDKDEKNHFLGRIIIDPTNGSIEDTIADGVIDPVKKRILRDLRATKDAYSSSLYVLYNATS